MSLHRQLLLAILISIFFAFAGSLSSTLIATRHYHEAHLAAKNADNAAALALSMSQLPKDHETLDAQIVSLFESGAYQSIRLLDAQGTELIARRAPPGDSLVPAWFVDLLPIISKPGIAMISDGFQRFGSVELTSMTNTASVDLYQGARNTLLIFLIANGLLCALAIVILSRIRLPIENIVTQARGLIDRRYLIVTPPKVPEFRTVSQAMNEMVERIQQLLSEEAERLDILRQQANLDELTGLAKRSYFMTRLHGALDPENGSGAGIMMLFRLRHLAEFNLAIGRVATDELIRAASGLAAQYVEANPSAFAGRLNGTDFALLLPGDASVEDTAECLDQALNALLESKAQTGVPRLASPFAATAATSYAPGEILGAVMKRIDDALAKAECGRGGSVVAPRAATQSYALAAQEWREKLLQALELQRIKLVSFPLLTPDGRNICRECYARLRFDDDGEWLTAAHFLPHLSRFKLTVDFDLAIADTLSEFARANEPLSIKISAESLAAAGFAARLAAIVAAIPGFGQRLSIDLPESGIIASSDGFHDLIQRMKPLGCRLGVNQFGRELKHIGEWQSIGLDYVKLDTSLVNELGVSRDTMDFLSGVCRLCHQMNLAVYAPGVSREDDLKLLFELGVDGATGPAVSDRMNQDQ